jgi:hypothetical protein
MHNSYKGQQSPDGKPAIKGKQILCLPIEATSEMGNPLNLSQQSRYQKGKEKPFN